MAAMAFRVDLGEEIAADVLDVEGDRHIGSRSLAVVYGPELAVSIDVAIFVPVVAGSTFPFAAGWLGWEYLLPVMFFDLVVTFSLRRLIDTRQLGIMKLIRRIYLTGTGMMLAMIVIRFAIG